MCDEVRPKVEFTLWSHEEQFYVGSQNVEANLRRLGRREVWLWLTTLAGMLLSAVAFVLLSVPALFRPDNPLFQLDPEITTRGLMGLVLLLSAYAVHRQWLFRRLRRRLPQQPVGWLDPSEQAVESYDPSAVDPVTGLCTRSFAEQWLTKEIASATREDKPLTLLVLALDDVDQMNEQYGKSCADLALWEFARRLRKASRGCDLAARLGADEFLLALPDCSVGAAKRVLDRLGTVEINCGGTGVTLAWSAAWLDCQAGQSPGELLARADQTLQLYEKASKESASAPLATQ